MPGYYTSTSERNRALRKNYATHRLCGSEYVPTLKCADSSGVTRMGVPGHELYSRMQAVDVLSPVAEAQGRRSRVVRASYIESEYGITFNSSTATGTYRWSGTSKSSSDKPPTTENLSIFADAVNMSWTV